MERIYACKEEEITRKILVEAEKQIFTKGNE